MSRDIAVVKTAYAAEEAYRLGYKEFRELDGEETEDFDLGPFYGTARYANFVLPNIRALAGYDDRGHGTFSEERQVAAIKPGCEEDNPADAELTESRHLMDEMQEAWRIGVYDAVEGKEYGASLDEAPPHS